MTLASRSLWGNWVTGIKQNTSKNTKYSNQKSRKSTIVERALTLPWIVTMRTRGENVILIHESNSKYISTKNNFVKKNRPSKTLAHQEEYFFNKDEEGKEMRVVSVAICVNSSSISLLRLPQQTQELLPQGPHRQSY
jgi:hypothetical protein